MLFRLVRPVKRKGSRYRQFVRRIPADVRSKATGLKLSIPVGDQTQVSVISPRAQSVRLSLRTDDPAEVKTRLAVVDAYLENVWRALREDAPVSLTHRQATALGGELYRAWTEGDERETTTAVEHDPEFLIPEDHILVRGADGKLEPGPWRRVTVTHLSADEWEAAEAHLDRLNASGNPRDLENPFGVLLDRLLLSKGIRRVDEPSRHMVLHAFWMALKDAFERRRLNAEGDYSPDPKALRFPEWSVSRSAKTVPPNVTKVSLKGLVESWWVEAKATGRKLSTYRSYANTIATFVSFLGHDDTSRVTRQDIVSFKDHRLASINPRNGMPVTAKTIKDNDLSALKTIYGWARANGKVDTNPAEGITIKLGKKVKLRSKSFTDAEAEAVLSAALRQSGDKGKPKTVAAKRWVPWLCAYTGARVGELAQLRKQDVRKDGPHWILTITPEALTVKTNEARDVVLHEHLIEQGFPKFVETSSEGYLFLTPSRKGGVLGPWRAVKNRIAEFVRIVVSDKNVSPSHAWRHRFKTTGMEAGIEHRILDVIQGHSPRNVAEGYGEVSIKAQAAAIAQIPRYKVAV